MGKPKHSEFSWARGAGGGELAYKGNPPPRATQKYCHIRKQLNRSDFTTQHWYCSGCGEHYEGCCPTEFVPECNNPAQCAFDKEFDL